MKTSIPLAFNPTFTPGVAGAGTLNFSTYAAAYGFAINRLRAVLDLATGGIIYAVGQGSGMAGSFNSGTNVLTLAANTSACGSGDALVCIYDETGAWAGKWVGVLTASTNLTVVKSSPGVLGMVNIVAAYQGSSTRNQYLKIFDKASNPILETDVPVIVVPCYGYEYNNNIDIPNGGIVFSSGIAYACTANAALNDTTAISIAGNIPIVNMAFN